MPDALVWFIIGALWGDAMSANWRRWRDRKLPPPIAAEDMEVARLAVEMVGRLFRRRQFIPPDMTATAGFEVRRKGEDTPVTVRLEAPGICAKADDKKRP